MTGSKRPACESAAQGRWIAGTLGEDQEGGPGADNGQVYLVFGFCWTAGQVLVDSMEMPKRGSSGQPGVGAGQGSLQRDQGLQVVS